MASVSMRRGKLAPSVRRKPDASFTQADTNWRMGIDAPCYTTTYQTSTSKAKEGQYWPMCKVNKNASDEVFSGGYRPPTNDPQFSTVIRQDYTLSKSVCSEDYTKRVPPEGFDRLRANRTNYSLGNQMVAPGGLKSATAELQMSNPQNRPSVQQPQIGGWTRRNSKGETYYQDIESVESVRRGGGGGEGILGVQFNIVTGECEPKARKRALLQAGPRRTLNNKEKEDLHPTDSWGDTSGHYIDIVTGKKRISPAAPPQPTSVSLRRPEETSRRTRPW